MFHLASIVDRFALDFNVTFHFNMIHVLATPLYLKFASLALPRPPSMTFGLGKITSSC